MSAEEEVRQHGRRRGSTLSDQGEVRSSLEEIESKAVTLVLILAIFLSIANSIWKFLDNQMWIFPLILLTLLILLRWLDTTRKKVELIAVSTPLRIYNSHAEYYSEVLRAVSKSEKSLYAVFSHPTAPSQQTEECRKYYVGALKWARKSPGRRALHRVIRLPSDNPEVQQWVEEQIDLATRIENYHVRVLRYPPGMKTEGENIAIIDSSIVFVGFAINERQELKGFSIQDHRVASAFEQYFHELWSTAGASTQAVR